MAITANEIRTGNLFQYFIGEEGCEWDTKKLDWQDIKWCEEENENFNKVHQPIPLTEAWIEDFGFRLQVVSKHDFKFNRVVRTDKVYTTNPFNLEEEDTFEIEVVKDGDDNQVRRIGLKGIESNIQFVHELQNLYFALTKTELVVQERGRVLKANTKRNYEEHTGI